MSINNRLQCRTCSGIRWMCSVHAGKPWQHRGCHAVGRRCACNPKTSVDWAELFARLDSPPKASMR